jgi:hypothetical protein
MALNRALLASRQWVGLALLLAGTVSIASGCIVVPAGYGYPAPRPVVIAPVPPVVVAPPPVYAGRRYGWWW